MDSLRVLLETSPFAAYLERCWDGRRYLNFPVGERAAEIDVSGTNAHALLFLAYGETLGLPGVSPGRAACLADWLADQVADDGLCRTQDGVTDHPAAISTVVDALGTAAHRAAALGIDGAGREKLLAAIRRVATGHPRIRPPAGVSGRSQQLRFELRVFYWLTLLDDAARWRPVFEEGWTNGLRNYLHPAALEGGLVQPSLHADWTWNYACSSGTTDRHATNTHTPAYYCTEPNGFMFVYLHALRHGAMERRDELDAFCRNYISGLARNLSRAGHLSSDLDGYGIHRAWYAPVLCEGIPVEAAALAEVLGERGWASRLRWYIDRFGDFLRRQPGYAETGLPDAQPYGHRIGIEAQFSRLATARVYASAARALAEFPDLDDLAPEAMPPFASYAWEAEWLRVSTPTYETSFAGHTCLRHVPVVPKYGDPHLGTLIGGAPLATLMAGPSLLYAASAPVAGLWHIEVDDHDGRRIVSCATGPEDERFMTVQFGDRPPLDACAFEPHGPPCNAFLSAGESVGVNYQRRERRHNLRFYVHNRYHADRIDLAFGMTGMAGHYYDRITFVLPLPSGGLEVTGADGPFAPVPAEGGELPTTPTTVRWRGGEGRGELRRIALSGDVAPFGALRCLAEPLPTRPGFPGGVHSFSPHRTTQLRFEITPDTAAHTWRFAATLAFP